MPGFDHLRKFALIGHPDHPSLVFLQSLEIAELCFLAVPVHLVRPDYQLNIADEDLDLIGAADCGPALRSLAILSLAEGEAPTANLLSPVVIHTESMRAVQAIRPDSQYSCREALACS
jgi:flagellar assembly factor FliW